MKSGDPMEVVCERLDDDGRGVAAGMIRVADLLPGERALVTVEHVSRHGRGAWATIRERIGESSPLRVAPACPAFGSCGGCRLQHLAEAGQLAAKRERVELTFREAGIAASVLATAASPRKLRYRNKGKYVIGLDDEGEDVVLGAYRPRSHRLVSTLGCAVVEPAIDALAQCAREAIGELGLEPFDELNKTGTLRYLIGRQGCDGRLAATIVTRRDEALETVAALGDTLLAKGGATGVFWAKNDRRDGGLFEDAPEHISGDPHVGEVLAGDTSDVDPHAFWQINRLVAAAIYAEIGEALRDLTPRRVLDAYAGVGAIGLAAAASGFDVTTVEIDANAAAVTREAAQRAGLAIEVLAADATAIEWSGYDAVVVNPPRRGLSSEVRTKLAHANPRHIIYVSCAPASLARDLADLATAGYRVSRVQPFDMMPGTTEVETLVIAESR